MINSMQCLVISTNPTSTQPVVKKVSSDMSFIYNEWKYEELKTRLDARGELSREAVLEGWNKEYTKASDICMNFYLKLSFYNSLNKEDRDIMKRSLYLLRKMLLLWPKTAKKYDQIKSIIQKMRINQNSQANNAESNNRFHQVLLNLLLILIEFEDPEVIDGQSMRLFELLEHNRAVQGAQGSHGSIYAQSNANIICLFHKLFKKLLAVARLKLAHSANADSFISETTKLVRDGLDQYVKQVTVDTRAGGRGHPVRIEISIVLLKLLFDCSPKQVDPMINNIRQAASVYKATELDKQQNKKGQAEITCKRTSKDNFKEPILDEQVIADKSLADDQDENAPLSANLKKYLFFTLLRITASKFSSYHSIDQETIL
jgi:hypothetical protein